MLKSRFSEISTSNTWRLNFPILGLKSEYEGSTNQLTDQKIAWPNGEFSYHSRQTYFSFRIAALFFPPQKGDYFLLGRHLIVISVVGNFVN